MVNFRAVVTFCLLAACADETVDVPWLAADVPEGKSPAGGGIRLTDLVVDQGVAVSVGANAAMIDVDDRNARLLAGRHALFRGLWEVPGDWEARDIEAHLTIQYDDGSHDTLSQTLFVEANADASRIDGTFRWLIPAPYMRAGMSVALVLTEVDNVAGDSSSPLPRLPTSGGADLDIEAVPHVISVRLIPISHELPGLACPGPPELDATLIELFRDRLFAYNPVERVDLDVRDVFVYTQSAGEFDDLLDALAQLRVTDQAPPEQYYYGLIQTCDGGELEVGGRAIAIPSEATPDNAWQRTAVGRFHPLSAGGAIETFIHEVGHTQGRRHAPCGEASGTDPDYPYPHGDVGTYGFNVAHGQLKPPRYKDYMGYCGPTWVSDYGWRLVFDRVETISSWASQRRQAAMHTQLIGSLRANGSTQWWTAPGAAHCAEPARQTVEFETRTGERLETRACIDPRPDSTTINLSVTIPTPFARMHYRVDQTRGHVDASTIRWLGLESSAWH